MQTGRSRGFPTQSLAIHHQSATLAISRPSPCPTSARRAFHEALFVRLPPKLALRLARRRRPPTGKVRQKLYVTNSAGDDVTIIDVATNKPIGRIEVGPHPHGIAVPAAQDVIFVTIEGTQSPANWSGSIRITDKVTRRMDIGPEPNQLAVTPDGKFAYVPVQRRPLRGHRSGQAQDHRAHLHRRPAAQHALLGRRQAHVPGADGRAEEGDHRRRRHAQGRSARSRSATWCGRSR